MDSFLLLGIDKAEMLDPESGDPFIYGVTFMQAGYAEWNAFPLLCYDPADTDQDGDVDTADLTVMFQNFTGSGGMGKTMMQGDTDLDGDGDGDADTADITTGLQNITGAQASLAASSLVTVHEPGGLVVRILGGLLLMFRLWRSSYGEQF